jgi:integrase
MFHIAIHFSLRISELITIRVQDFHASHDANLSHFGKWGVLTVTGKGDVTGSIPMRDPSIHELVVWYTKTIRESMILRREPKDDDDGLRKVHGKQIRVADLLFISERGGVICPNAIRKRLADIAMKAGVLRQKLTPHTLRHTGCTLMVPLYSPEIAQKYMRHKHLHTTLYYYHPSPLAAANEVNGATQLFDDEED